MIIKGRILITGGTGFLGNYLINELSETGYSLRVLARNPKAAARLADRAEIIEGDILDILTLEKALEGVDYVLHSAASVSFWKKEYAGMYEINVKGTENVVDACLDQGNIKKLVHISSVAALGRTGTEAAIDERTLWKDSKFNTRYGKTKYIAEKEVHRGVQEGLPAVILNPGIILGPGDWESGSPKLFTTLYKGLSWYNPGITGFVAAVDVARAARILLETDSLTEGERFVLVAENLEWKEMFSIAANSIGAKAPRRKAPKLLARFIGAMSERFAGMSGGRPLITRETVRTSRGKFRYDGSLITRTVDFTYSDIREVIRQTGAKFKEEHAAQGKR